MSTSELEFEAKSLLAPTEFSRRGFLTTSLVAGFTPATGPVNAQSVITTDSNGPTAGEVKVPAAPVLGLCGSADQGIPTADVEKMRAALKAAKKPSEIVLYDGAPHGFHADYRPSYRETPAKDGWQRLRAWFQQNGAA